MRNTGLDGNGTFGTRTFLTLETDHPLRTSLSAQMLCAYMMRVFALDLLHHLARSSNANAARLDAELSRFLGVGNGSALGLMLYVNNHAQLIDRWIGIRETALAHAKSLAVSVEGGELTKLLGLLDKAITFRRQDRAEYEAVISSTLVADDLTVIRGALARLADRGRGGSTDT